MATQRCSVSFLYTSHLLLEVAPIILVHQHEINEVPYREFLIGIAHGWRQVVAGEEEANGHRLTCNEPTTQMKTNKTNTLAFLFS
jgi:hypothetical protein